MKKERNFSRHSKEIVTLSGLCDDKLLWKLKQDCFSLTVNPALLSYISIKCTESLFSEALKNTSYLTVSSTSEYWLQYQWGIYSSEQKRGLCISTRDFMGDSGRHCSCSGRAWKLVCNTLPPLSCSSVSPLSTSGRLMVATRGHVIYVIYECVWIYSDGGAGGQAVVGGASKEFTVYAYQGFPALLNMQAPPVVLREVGYRPL